MRYLFLKFLLIASFCCQPLLADSLTIATASNFRPLLAQLADRFSRQTGHQVTISSASSGVLYAQIQQGAPFQIFFSANASYPEKLLASGHGVNNTLATYAIGKLMLVSRSGGSDPREVLTSANRIAIANPRTAPYGMAAVELFETLGIAEASKRKWVIGNNIAQAWQFYRSGNADAAVTAASLLSPDQRRSAIDLSAHLKQPLLQKRVMLTPDNPLAREFLAFLDSPDARKMLVDGGYLLPELMTQ